MFINAHSLWPFSESSSCRSQCHDQDCPFWARVVKTVWNSFESTIAPSLRISHPYAVRVTESELETIIILDSSHLSATPSPRLEAVASISRLAVVCHAMSAHGSLVQILALQSRLAINGISTETSPHGGYAVNR